MQNLIKEYGVLELALQPRCEAKWLILGHRSSSESYNANTSFTEQLENLYAKVHYQFHVWWY